ncbi:hypothetical protein Tco_1574609 [Tanacetum coccineum]
MSSDKSSSFMSSFTLSSDLSFGLPLLFMPSTTKASTLLTEADCLSLTVEVFFQEQKSSGVYSLRQSLSGTFLSQRTSASALHFSHVALIRPWSSGASLRFSSMLFKPSTDSKTSTITSAKIKHHEMSS